MTSELIHPGLTYIADNIISKQNILGVSKEQGARWAKDLNLSKKAETVFFAGCGYQFSHQLETMMSLIQQMDKSALGAESTLRFAGLTKKLGINPAGMFGKVTAKGDGDEAQPLKAAINVLHKLGIQPGYLADDEPCCGASLYNTGLQKQFAENARKAYQKFNSFGVKRVIGMVPYCTHALSKLFPRYAEGYNLEVKHFLEVVSENLSSLKLQFPRQVKMTYHDPCQLVRYLSLVEEPRQILRSIKGLELVETEWTKGKWATCCGGGGGLEAVFPELSQILAVNRVGELLETGAEIIVTHCPGCVLQLKAGLKEHKADGVEVLDLAQIIDMSMEK